MNKRLFLTLLSILFSALVYGQLYKEMMSDPSYNFYEVVAEAEAYFKTIDRDKKGSGYKPFMRWVQENERYYYPSGRRDNIDPQYSKNILRRYQNRFPEQLSSNTNKMTGSGWRELGPDAVDFITGHYAAGIGRIEDAYVDPNNEDIIYLGSRSGGLWRTTNGGTTWTGGSTDFLPASGVNTITAKPSNSSHLLVNIQNAKNGYSYGIYSSIDGGATVIETNFNPTNLGFGGLGSSFRINRVKYHPTIDNLVFVGASNGLYRSTDNMNTWSKVVNSGNISLIEFHPTNPDIVYATNRSGGSVRNYLLKSSDGGVTFSQTPEVVGNDGAVSRISVVPDVLSEENSVYWVSSNGLWKSTDSGDSFTFQNAVPSVGIAGFVVNSTDPTNMIMGYVDVYNSTDSGATFNQQTRWSLGDTNFHPSSDFQTNYDTSTSYVHADTNYSSSVNGVFYVMTDGFLAKSEDGGDNWENIMRSGVGVRENYKLGISQSNNGIAMCGSQDNGSSIYKDTGWVEFYGADGMEGIVHPLNDEWMLSSFQYGGRRRTKDGGFSQDGVTPSGSSGGNWQAPLAYDPNDHLTIFDFRDGVRKSTEFGDNYSLIGTPSFTGNIENAEIAQNNSQIIVVSSGSNLEKSTDGGVTFSSIKGTLPNASIQDIAFDPLDDNRLFVVYASFEDNGQKVYMSEDGGGTWTNITFNLNEIPVHTIVIDHSAEKHIYVGTEIGAFTKPLNGTIWELFSTGLPNTTVEELEINWAANTIKAATWGRGLWETDLVGKESYPSINLTVLTDPPTNNHPKESVEQFVTSTIEYGGTLTDVYVQWSIGTPDFTIPANKISMSNLGGAVWRSDTEIPNQPEGTKVYFKVFALGDSGDLSATYKFMYTVKPFELCQPSVQNGTADYIDLVEVDDNTSTTIFSNASGNDGYTSYNNTPIEMKVGQDYEIRIQMPFAFSDDDAGVWIDFNRNAEFDDNENVIMSDYVSNISTGTISVPYDVVINQVTTMRVRNSFYDVPDPCNFDAGEVEDYQVIFTNTCSSTRVYDGSWSSGVPSLSDKAVFVSDYNTNALSIEACEIEIQSGATVTVSPNTFLRAIGNITVNGTLIIEHEGSVVQVFKDAIVNKGATGVIEVHKTTLPMKPRDFMFTSSPMSAESRAGVYGNVIDDATNTVDEAFRVIYLIPENYVPDPAVVNSPLYAGAETFLSIDNTFLGNHNADEALIPGEGLIVYPQHSLLADGITSTYNFVYSKGTLNSGDINYPIHYNGPATTNNFNLLGNPYPSAIDIDMLIDANPMINEIYYWEHVTTPTNTLPGYLGANPSMLDFSIRNKTTGLAAPNKPSSIPTQYMASGQGFAIKADQNAQSVPDVVFNNSMRVTGSNDQYRSSQEKDLLFLSLVQDDYAISSKTVVGFLESATQDFDQGYDSFRIATPLSLYTVLQDGKQLSIQGREPFKKDMVIPLGMSTAFQEKLSYTIQLDTVLGNALQNKSVYLIDLKEETYVNLLENNYTFDSDSTNESSRFVIVFRQPETLSIAQPESSTTAKVLLYPNPAQNQLVIESIGNPSIEEVQIINNLGAIVDKVEASNTTNTLTIDVSQLSRGMYFVAIRTVNEIKVKKVLLK